MIFLCLAFHYSLPLRGSLKRIEIAYIWSTKRRSRGGILSSNLPILHVLWHLIKQDSILEWVSKSRMIKDIAYLRGLCGLRGLGGFFNMYTRLDRFVDK